MRHGVTHPVVVDTEHRIRDAFAVTSWPALVIVGSDGVIVGSASGEPEHLTLTATLRGILGNAAGQLRGGPLPLRRQSAPPGPLVFPGGIVVAEDGTIYVADTGNHAVRSVDLASGDVTTLAGTGRRGRDLQPGPARRVDLRSPWDLVVVGDGALVVSMAGSHQLWGVEDGTAAPYAGTGREARVDADRGTAAFAQPSRLCAVPGAGADRSPGDPVLFVPDSENSATRPVGDGQVRKVTLDAPLDAPEALAAEATGTVLVADTGNHSALRIDIESGRSAVVLGAPRDTKQESVKCRDRLPTTPPGA